MKKILIFSTAYLPLIGGAELAVKAITDRLPDYEFDLICARLKRDLPKKEKIGRVAIHRIGFGNNFDKILLPFLGFLKAREIAKNDKLKIGNWKLEIILWGIMASWGSLAGLFLKISNPQIPFLLTLQEGDAENHIAKSRFGLINFSWRWLLKKADYVQAISGYLADLARKYGYKGKIEIVPNGVDLQKFKIQNGTSSSQARAKFKITSQNSKLKVDEYDKIIITVSRLVEKNGMDDLIDAFKLLIANYQPPVKLLVIGTGPLDSSLKFKVKSLKLENEVFFLGDIPNEEISKYLAISDVFVRPSLSEGLGTAFLEAMAVGVPVVGTPVGGIPDFLKDGETGLFCEVRNSTSIAEKIKMLLEDEDLRTKIINNASKIVREKYDWDSIARRMSDIMGTLSARERFSD